MNPLQLLRAAPLPEQPPIYAEGDIIPVPTAGRQIQI